MSLRASTQTIILIELIVGISFLMYGIVTLNEYEVIWLVPTMLFIHLAVFSAPLALAKGFNFVIYDADPRSLWKVYGFLAIGISVFFGTILDGNVYEWAVALAS